MSTTVPRPPADEQNVLGRRVCQDSRYYSGGTQLGPSEAIDLLLERLIEAERRLARIAHAVRDDERRAA
jgi:hypothetical protein